MATAPADHRFGSWPLVGRQAHVDDVISLLRSKEIGAVVLAGDAGVGKTRLANEILERARDVGFATERVITSVVLSRLPSVTHLADVDQRTIELEFTKSSDGTIDATIPENKAVALPGHYYLFLMTDNGQGPTPSRAAIVQIGETDHARAAMPFGI